MVVLSRIRPFPTLISMIKWLRSGLSLTTSIFEMTQTCEQTLMELILACWSWTWNGIFHSSQGNFNAWRRSNWYFNWKCTDNEERPERTIETSSSSRWNPLTSGIGSTGSQTGSDFWLTKLPEPSLTVTKTESRSSKSEDYPQPRFSLPLSIRPKIFYGPSKKNFQIFQNFRLGLISLLNILPF